MKLKFLFITSIVILWAGSASAQAGCTDPYASNYDPTATVNDGSCVYPVTHDTPALRTVLPLALAETSGLVWDNGKLWTHGDSGNPNTFYSIDTTDGHVLQTVYVDNYPNTDWEDITVDADYIYIGDIGNNTGDRTDLKILKIAKAAINTDTAVHVNAQAIFYSYSDQTNFTPTQLTNFDCESLISIGDSLYVFTKDRLDNKTRVYKMPKMPGTYIVDPYTNYNVGGILTAASYNASTHEIVLLGYTLLKTNSFMWFLNDYGGDMFFSGNKRRIEIGGNTEWQTEGIAFLSADRYFISNETATVNASLYIGDKSWLGSLNVSNNLAVSQAEIYPNPFSDKVYVGAISTKGSYRIVDLPGRVVAAGSLEAGQNHIELSRLGAGVYLLVMRDEQGGKAVKRIVKE